MVPSAETLDKLVGRIALYPDDLVALILPASTFPLEIVQAERYLQKRKADPKLPFDQNWDDSVKTLLNYPDVVKSMSDDLDWTSDLGEAVVADQGAVLEAIQVFRRRTQSVGNLKSDDKQTVVVEKEVITIVPANPQVIYVPTYNPSTVVVTGGYSSYGYYPAPYPSYYYPYPPGAALATGLIFGAAIGSAWNGGRYGTNWGGGGNNNININRNTNINTGGNTNISNRSVSGAQRSGSASGQSSQWKSNKQPGQVSSGGGRSQSARVGDSARGGAGSAASGVSNRGGGAFDSGGASGRQTQMDSSRGAASRASSSSVGSRQSSAGSARSSGAGAGARSGGASAGARSGGGGGARAGGGRGGGGRR
jgi:hypothetical protein